MNNREALKELEEMIYQKKRKQYPNAPDYAVARVKYSDNTANGLTKAVVDYLKASGHKAWRQSSEGRYRPGKVVTNVIGQRKQLGGTYLPGQNNGAADVCAIIRGQFIGWEVKMNDRQSEAQKRYQGEIEASGGKYFICRSFDEFINQYKAI